MSFNQFFFFFSFDLMSNPNGWGPLHQIRSEVVSKQV